MKATLKTVVIITGLLAMIQANAQSFQLKAGHSSAKLVIKESGSSENLESLPTFLIGFSKELPVSDKVFFEPGLYFTQRGYSEKDSNGDYSYKYKMAINYLYAPIDLKLVLNPEAKARFFVTAGPYVGVALWGKTQYESTYQGDTEKNSDDIKIGQNENEYDVKRLDIGLGARFGAEFSTFVIAASYNLGLTNIAHTGSSDFKVKNNSINLTLGYRFLK